jgi:threonine dehydrogenase-like Zn-dependent dehydrogenase
MAMAPNNCKIRNVWIFHLTGGFAGGQAEYVRVPFGDVNLLKLPDDVPDEKGLYLSDVLATSWNAVVDTGVQNGDVVAVWGAGPIGQMGAEFAFVEGAKRVILIDGGSSTWRLAFAKRFARNLETIVLRNSRKASNSRIR